MALTKSMAPKTNYKDYKNFKSANHKKSFAYNKPYKKIKVRKNKNKELVFVQVIFKKLNHKLLEVKVRPQKEKWSLKIYELYTR